MHLAKYHAEQGDSKERENFEILTISSVQDHLGFVEVLLFECSELSIVVFCLLLILDDGQKRAHFCAVYQTKGLIIASLPMHRSHACSQ